MAASRLVSVRMPEKVFRRAAERARELGYIKASGEENISEYIRNLIINDRR
jgi:hypothetical protein